MIISGVLGASRKIKANDLQVVARDEIRLTFVNGIGQPSHGFLIALDGIADKLLSRLIEKCLEILGPYFGLPWQ